MKHKLLNILLVLFSIRCAAEGLVVNVPSKITVNDNFHLTYTIASQEVGELHLGTLPSGLELITGPYRSSQSSYQMINGHASSSSSTTFTFILCAVKEGVYKVPAASVTCGGHKYASKPITIKVTSHGKVTSRTNENAYDYRGGDIKSSDLFIKVTANKKEVYEQEPVRLTYKVYTLVGLNELNGKMPDLKGFHSLEVPMPQQKSFHIESLNGKPYKCITWSEYIMYPQMSGQLEIPSIDFIGTVVQRNNNVDPIEALFNGGADFIETKRKIIAPGLKINVMSLPNRPSDFSGGVGSFNISAQANSKSLKSNEPFTFRIVLSGKGNLKLIKAPGIDLPKDFDKYDPKVTDKTKITENGLEGNIIYDYTIVPRNHGHYTIPPIKFVYFDTQSKSYKTIQTQSFVIEVAKGNSDGSDVSDYNSDFRNSDIRKLKIGDCNYYNLDQIYFGTSVYYLTLAFVLFAGIVIVVILRNGKPLTSVLRMNSNLNPNRQAIKRLSRANGYKLHGNNSKFYEEVFKSLWDYASEMLGVQSSELSRDVIISKFKDYGIDKSIIEMFMQTLDECEFVRYSPSESVSGSNKIFENAMYCLVMIEKGLKKKRSNILRSLLIFVVLFSMPAFSITKDKADKEYEKGDYQQAIIDYQYLLKEGKSPEVYYNLGNAYYRTDNITQSILAYERALKMSPYDDDIIFNLRLAESKTIDKMVSTPDIFIVSWFNSFVGLMGIDAWAYFSIACLVFFFMFMLVYLKTNGKWKKWGFTLMVLMVISFFLCVSCAYSRLNIMSNDTGAIVVVPAVNMKSVPDDKGEDVGVIHEGSKVEILDKTMKNWINIRLVDQRQGWIKNSCIEEI